jgi:hypothetical protein
MILFLKFNLGRSIMGVCNWAEEEMTELDTGDKRLDKRTTLVLQTVADKPNMSLDFFQN